MAGMGGYMMVPMPTPFYRGGRGRTFRYSYSKGYYHSEYHPYTQAFVSKLCRNVVIKVTC